MVALLLVLTPMAVRDHLQINTQTKQLSTIRAATKLVYLETGGNGSGVMIAPNRMLTAAHVAEVHSRDRPLMVDGRPIIKVLKIDYERDLALISVASGCPCVPVGSLPENDTDVELVGYPLNGYVGTQIVTEGRTQGLHPDKQRLIATTNASPGNSGGGLYAFQKGEWRLVGILIQISGVNGPIFGTPAYVHYLSYSVDTDTIKGFLADAQT
jgi:hypothetical protein